MADLNKIVNTNRYPIDIADKESEEYLQLVDTVRANYTELGIVTLPGFLRTNALREITQEISTKSGKVWRTITQHNIFQTKNKTMIFHMTTLETNWWRQWWV